VYEIVEEVSEAIFRVFIVCSISSVIYRSFDIPPWGILVATLIVCLMACNKAIYEVMSWKNEIYVVVSDETNGGGIVYKFWGWLNKHGIYDSITGSNVVPVFEQSKLYAIWGKLTGEHMERVKLQTAKNGAYIEGRRISPQFRHTIDSISGYKPKSKELTSENASIYHLIREIQFAYDHNSIDEHKKRNMTEEVLRKAVYQ
jgi:hypothetical protein